MRARKDSENTDAVYRVAAFQTFLSGRISTFGDSARTLNYQIARNSTRYPADCPAPCPAGQIVLTTAQSTVPTLTIPLVPAGSKGYRNERLKQLDLKVGKTFRVRNLRISGAFEAFNITNSDTIITYASTNFGTSWSQPNSILQGRVLGLSTKVQW